MTENSFTQEEKLLSLFSHFSILFGGIFVPLILWLINKDKSKYVAFHSLQALWFQMSYIIVVFIMTFLFLIVLYVSGFNTGLFSGGKDMPAFMIIIMIIFYAIVLILIFAAIGYSIYVGIKAGKGEIKKYIFIGNIIYKKVYGNNFV